MVRPDFVERTSPNTLSSIPRNRGAPGIQEPSGPSLGFLQAAADFSIHDGSIASIGGDSYTARGDVHVTVNHNYPSSPSSSSSSLIIPTETRLEEQEPAHVFTMQNERRIFSEDTFARAPLPVQRSCEIYRRHLEAKGRGISLWIPEPSKNLPKQYQRNGIAIGDVGIITSSGSFHFLFNVCLPKEHPINPRRMPNGFEPLSSDVLQDFDVSVQRELKENSYLASVSSVRVRRNGDSTGLVFESSEQDGAILTMPVGAKSEDLNNVVRFRKYVSANMKSWYQYAYHDRGFEIRNGDLRVVTGTDKTSAWGMATFSNSGAGCSNTRREPASPMPGSEPKFHLEFGVIPNGDGPSDRQARKYGWEYSGVAEVRAGPDDREVLELRDDHIEDDDDDVVYENQCLFIRTLNTTLPDKIWEQLGIDEDEVDYGDGYGYHSMNGSPSSSSSSSFSSSGQGGNSSSGSGTNQGGSFLSSGSHNQVALNSTRTPCTSPFWRPTYVDSPSMALADHPSNAINQFLLQNCSEDTTMAVTLDQDWIAVLREDDCVLPSSEELLERIIESYDIREEDGIVFLDAKSQGHDEICQGSSSIAILCLEDTVVNSVTSEETSEASEGSDFDFDFDMFAAADPNISRCASLLKKMHQMFQNVKVHQKKCWELRDRSLQLLQELQALEKKAPDIICEVDGTITQTLRKAEVWSSWSSMKSFLRQGQIRQDIEMLGAGINAALVKISILRTPLRPLSLKGARDRDKPGVCSIQHTLRNTDSTSSSMPEILQFSDRPFWSSHSRSTSSFLANVPDATCQWLFNGPVFEWSRHLPAAVPLDRKSDDRALELFFELSSSWPLRIVPALFRRDMYRALSVPKSDASLDTPYYSPMLHNALITMGLAHLDDHRFNDPMTRQHFARKAKSFMEVECQRPNLSVVHALSILAGFHSSQGENTLGYMYSGMSARIAQTLGLDVVGSGCTFQDKSEAFWTPFSRDLCWSLYVGRDHAIEALFDTEDVDQRHDHIPWIYPPSGLAQSNSRTQLFLKANVGRHSSIPKAGILKRGASAELSDGHARRQQFLSLFSSTGTSISSKNSTFEPDMSSLLSFGTGFPSQVFRRCSISSDNGGFLVYQEGVVIDHVGIANMINHCAVMDQPSPSTIYASRSLDDVGPDDRRERDGARTRGDEPPPRLSGSSLFFLSVFPQNRDEPQQCSSKVNGDTRHPVSEE